MSCDTTRLLPPWKAVDAGVDVGDEPVFAAFFEESSAFVAVGAESVDADAAVSAVGG
jgi:hypothetical protein